MTAVDECFEELLNDMFGAPLMAEFRAKRPAGYVDLMIAFESRKRSCAPAKLAPLNIALPFSFIDFYRKQKGKDVRSGVTFEFVHKFTLQLAHFHHCFPLL